MRRAGMVAAVSAGALVVAAMTAGSAQATPPSSTRATFAAHRATSLSRAQTSSVRAQARAGTLARTRGVAAVCADAKLACQLLAVTASKRSLSPLASSYDQLGYGAADLVKAYGLTKAKAGSGTVAVIETGNYPSLDSDLSIYRSFNDLRACSVANKCLKIVNKNGGATLEPTPTDPDLLFGEEDVATETALDVDMVSAACPACHILVVDLPIKDAFYPDTTSEANAQFRDFDAGVTTAVRLGAHGVSLSYGLPSSTYSDTTAAKAFRQPGVAITASTGDSGANGDFAPWPQDLTTVIAAGGTSLFPSGNGFTQSAWEGAGSSCSRDLGRAVGQPANVASACDGHRASADVSTDADPFTGVSLYDSYAPATGEPLGFAMIGGTSASAPFITAMNVRAGVAAGAIGPNELYTAPKGSITDVTVGANASPGQCPEPDLRNCDAGKGWDGPTGLGSPKGLAPFSH